MANKVPGAAARARPVVVFNSDEIGNFDDSSRIRRLIPAGIISVLIHLTMLPLLYFVKVNESDASVDVDSGVYETQVEENNKPPSLENEDIGNDPSVETNYNVDRIAEISVPGPVNNNEKIGTPDSETAPPSTLPPPPGVGGNVGTGGGNDSPDAGKANMVGMAGGLGGSKDFNGFKGRSGSTRVKMAMEGGGNTKSEAAVAAGLRWISQHQAPDGHWSIKDFGAHGKCSCDGAGGVDNDTAATAFGLLPMLGAGQTHKSGADKENRYVKIVDRGLKYLIHKQARDGAFDLNMYAHGLATIAVCEAYGLTSDPTLRGPAQRALNYIIAAQSAEGGWRYQAGQPGYDTSIGGWELMALKSGQMAGLDVPKKTMTAASKWLDAAALPDGGSYGYTSPGDGLPTTAVGLLCREYLGWGPRSPGLIAGVKRLDAAGPSTNSMYYNYYGTQVMHHLGGASWDKWNVKMRDQLTDTQDDGKTKPHQKGSWYNKDDAISSVTGGRLMTTSLSLVTLEIYYRHLPLYRRGVLGDKD